VRDLDSRIAQLDQMVKAATGRGWTRTAMALVGRQSTSRATLVIERQQAAERLADLKVQQANVETQRARTLLRELADPKLHRIPIRLPFRVECCCCWRLRGRQ
jgi:hypothetical protein